MLGQEYWNGHTQILTILIAFLLHQFTIMGRAKGSKNLKNVKVFHANAGQHGKFAQAAQELRDGRIVDDTKYQYGLKIETMKWWFRDQEEYTDVLDLFNEEGELIIPVQTDRVFKFLWLLDNEVRKRGFHRRSEHRFPRGSNSTREKSKKTQKAIEDSEKEKSCLFLFFGPWI